MVRKIVFPIDKEWTIIHLKQNNLHNFWMTPNIINFWHHRFNNKFDKKSEYKKYNTEKTNIKLWDI